MKKVLKVKEWLEFDKLLHRLEQAEKTMIDYNLATGIKVDRGEYIITFTKEQFEEARENYFKAMSSVRQAYSKYTFSDLKI